MDQWPIQSVAFALTALVGLVLATSFLFAGPSIEVIVDPVASEGAEPRDVEGRPPGLDRWNPGYMPARFALQDAEPAAPALHGASVSSRSYRAPAGEGRGRAVVVVDIYHGGGDRAEYDAAPQGGGWTLDVVRLADGTEATFEASDPGDHSAGVRVLRWRADGDTYVSISVRGDVDDDELLRIASELDH